jgi:hypothetical protein
MLGLLGPAELVNAMARFCDVRIIKVKQQQNVSYKKA